MDGSVEYKFGRHLAPQVQGSVSGSVNCERCRRATVEDFGWTASAGFPVTRSLGFKAAYFETEHWAKVGIASQTVSVGLVGSW
jgi:hypothetical protein